MCSLCDWKPFVSCVFLLFLGNPTSNLGERSYLKPEAAVNVSWRTQETRIPMPRTITSAWESCVAKNRDVGEKQLRQKNRGSARVKDIHGRAAART